MVTPKLVAKIESEEPALRPAVLIDADNAQAAVIEELLTEIARFGETTVKRIYGDFTSPAAPRERRCCSASPSSRSSSLRTPPARMRPTAP